MDFNKSEININLDTKQVKIVNVFGKRENTNHLTFNDWMTDLDEGSNKCFLMYDDCIIKILNTLGANIPESHLFYA